MDKESSVASKDSSGGRDDDNVLMCSTDCVDTMSSLRIEVLNPTLIKEERIKRRLDRLAMRRLVPSAD